MFNLYPLLCLILHHFLDAFSWKEYFTIHSFFPSSFAITFYSLHYFFSPLFFQIFHHLALRVSLPVHETCIIIQKLSEMYLRMTDKFTKLFYRHYLHNLSGCCLFQIPENHAMSNVAGPSESTFSADISSPRKGFWCRLCSFPTSSRVVCKDGKNDWSNQIRIRFSPLFFPNNLTMLFDD